VNCGESVCTIGICYVVNKINLPQNSITNIKKQFQGGGGSQDFGHGGGG
jgi:hypothetical protein